MTDLADIRSRMEIKRRMPRELVSQATVDCDVLLAEIDRLQADNDRLRKRCDALALLHYGKPDIQPELTVLSATTYER